VEKGVMVIGYRHPESDKKSVQARFMSEALKKSRLAGVPRYVYLAKAEDVDSSGLAEIKRALDGAEFLICKGDIGAASYSNNSNYILCKTSCLEQALKGCGSFSSGVVVQELIQTSDFWPGANAMLHKAHFMLKRGKAGGEARFGLMSSRCLKIPNMVDLDLIRRQGVVFLKDAVRCLGDWHAGDLSSLPQVSEIGTGLDSLDPLCSISTVDMLISQDSKVWFLESNHFSGAYLDIKYNERAPIDTMPDIIKAKLAGH
jgi:hypothetical protein